MSKAEEGASKLIIPKQVNDVEELCMFYYIKGYNQAEKDSELAWKDMEEIVEIANLLETEWLNSMPWDGIRDWGFYKEVLKRFNEERKGK